MKYRIAGLAAVLCVLVVVFFASTCDSGNPNTRVHQHLTSRQPDAGCDCDKTELCTHLPLVILDTGQAEIPGDPEKGETALSANLTRTSDTASMLAAKMSIMSNEAQNHHPSDAPDLESDILIRIRGNSSRYYDKKSYLIRLTDAEGYYQDQEVMGMSPHYEWALYGPFLDKALIRNYMWYNIAGEFMDYAPNVRFCEVILDGSYQGLYMMTETITKGDDCRLDLTKPIEGLDRTGYILRQDRGSSNPIKDIHAFTCYTYRNTRKINIEYPHSDDLTEDMADWIEQEFSDFEKSLYSYDYDTDNYGYQHNIDVQSFVDYFIINEFTANYDAGLFSTYFYRDIGEKYKMVVWDFDAACDNYNDTTIVPQGFSMQQYVRYFMLTKEEHFVEAIFSRYRALRKTYLSEDYLNQYVDDTIAYLGPAIDRNFSVWGYAFEDFMPLKPQSRNPADFDAAVRQLKTFIHERGTWMDENIEVLRQYCHESKNKKFNH